MLTIITTIYWTWAIHSQLANLGWKGGSRHVHLYWLLPITAAERQFKAQNGLKALEELFEQQALQYWEPDRLSIV